jgi:serine/threonine-protein kinase ATR
MTVTLPSDGDKCDLDYNPFPHNLATIAGFEDKISILPSLQKPRKVTIKGNDGNPYVFLCKPKDDLRKDCRMMEFNSLINKLLKKEPESRQRQLRIRTYAVVPLNDECGLLEWVILLFFIHPYQF